MTETVKTHELTEIVSSDPAYRFYPTHSITHEHDSPLKVDLNTDTEPIVEFDHVAVPYQDNAGYGKYSLHLQREQLACF